MPEPSGNSMSECISACVNDPEFVQEEPNKEERVRQCTAVCADYLSRKEGGE